ncbi:Glycosyl transferase family 2 [Candidatus Zixiibacteriota bacterium]|nr:Glycosyl transferase family 2 [candidate division Zixibacteria bacterium]
MLLTVIMPLYNEERTAAEIISRVLSLPLDLELIIVNNGSTDRTKEIIHGFAPRSNLRIIDKDRNIGKGDAIIDGLRSARGEFTVIQDGDLEYAPEDFERMIKLAQDKGALAVFGSRIRHPESGISYQRYLWGGKLLTVVANFLFRVNITDESTCYKMIRTDIMKQLNLQCRRFEFCPEVVAKLGRNKIKIHEIPVAYHPRKFEEGKKIRWIDGLEAVWTLIKYRFQPLARFAVKKSE